MKRCRLATAWVGMLLMLVAGCGGSEARDEEPSSASSGARYRGSEPPRPLELARFSLRNYSGAVVTTRSLAGKVVVLTFLDSQCEEACPIVAASVARALDRLQPRERRHVAAVAISTDPGEDSPASVRAFLRRQRALGKLLYLRGPETQMRAVWRRFKVLSSLESGQDEVHSAPVRIYDRRGVWVATLHAGVDLTPENLVHDVRVALDSS